MVVTETKKSDLINLGTGNHSSWALDRSHSRVVDLDLRSLQPLIAKGFTELSQTGNFQRTFATPPGVNTDVLKTIDEGRAVLATLALAMELRRRSGAFMIAGGAAFNDMAATDLFCVEALLMRQPHSEMEFFILKSDLPKLLNTLSELEINITGGQSKIFHTIFFDRVAEYNSDSTEIRLNFSSDSFMPSLKFTVIEEAPKGYTFNPGTPFSFVFPQPYLCYPKFYFNILLEGTDPLLPLMDLKISSYLLANGSVRPTNEELHNLQILDKGLPN